MSKPNATFIKNRKRLFKALVNNGCYLFPIKRYRKLPKGMWADISTNDWNKIETWIDRKLNIGIDTGKSGLLVIDIDPKVESAAEMQDTLELLYDELPKTFTVNTASGGTHLYFKAPNSELGNTAGGLMEHVDTRGFGGYVVGPGSVVLNKDVAADLLISKTFDSPEKGEIEYFDFDYQTLFKEDLEWLYYDRVSTGKIGFANLPEAFIDKLTEVSESPTKGVATEIDEEDVDSDQAIEGAIDYCKLRHPPAVENENGDNTTFQLFTRVRDMGITEDTAVDLAEEYYNPRCEPPWDLEDLQRIASHAYTYAKEPLGIMSAHADFKLDEEEVYDEELLTIVVPETGKVIKPKMNKERAALPQEEKKQAKVEEKHQTSIDETDRLIRRLNTAFSEKASKVRYVYVMTEDEVYNRLTRDIIKPGAFCRSKRLEYQHYMEDAKCNAFEAAEDMGNLIHADSFDYLPGANIFAHAPKDPKSIVWNTYVQPTIAPEAGKTPNFDRYINTLFDKPGDREVVLNYMAHRLQNPTSIHTFCLLVFGNHGSGKTLFAQLLGTLVGLDNFNLVKAGDVKSQFNGWAMNKQVILLDECFDLGTLEIANALKMLVGAKEISINRKNKNQIKVTNHADYILTSNYTDAVRMDKGERRYYVIETNREMKTDSDETLSVVDPIHAMVQDRNEEARQELRAIYHKLLSRDLSNYNPHALPARTDAMEAMIKANRTDWQSFLIEAIDNKEHGFAFDAYAVSDIATLLRQAGFNRGLKYSAIEGFLKDNDFDIHTDCRTKDFRKNIAIIRNKLLWDNAGNYGVKKALAEYVKQHSSQAVEYYDGESIMTTEQFLKTFDVKDNVSPLK